MQLWNKYQSTIKKIFLILLIFATIYLSITYLLPFFAPFVIALIVSYINEPVIKLLQKLKISRKAAAAISLLFTMSVLGFALTVGIIKIYNELIVLQDNLTSYSSDISVKINKLIDKATIFYNGLPEQVTSAITKNLESFSEQIGSMITSVIQYVINTVTSIPRLTVFVIVTILGTYFISSDKKVFLPFFTDNSHFPGEKT
nr:AI-2E family transporter [Ruminiclostridium josui]